MLKQVNDLLIRSQRVNVLQEQAQRNLDSIEKEISSLSSEIEILNKVSELFKHLLDSMIVDNVKKVEDLVSYGLNVVFDDQNLKFIGEIKRGKGKIGIEFKTLRDGKIGGSSVESFGGSIVVVESFLLRLLSIVKLSLRRLVVLDESFAEVDPEYSLNVSKLLREMCEKLNFDLLLVTHNKSLLESAHRVYKVEEDSKSSIKIEQVK